ncbi:MAG: hypothetical protein HYS15_00315 [Candidatus Spechtbacteria bacterium]|nr:hypothetical protein [Candidatus Spechtbacteria bacterium]
MATRKKTTTEEITTKELKREIRDICQLTTLTPGQVHGILRESGITCSLNELNTAFLALVRDCILDTSMSQGSTLDDEIIVRFHGPHAKDFNPLEADIIGIGSRITHFMGDDCDPPHELS